MSSVEKKMELPSVTKKKNDIWNEMRDLYNTSYNQLTNLTATVKVIVASKNMYGDHVDITILTNMINALSKNVENLRNTLNGIYQRIQSTDISQYDVADVNMEAIQYGQEFSQWSNQFITLCAQPLDDIVNYVQPPENTNE